MTTNWSAIPGRAVTKAAVSHIDIEYEPNLKMRAFSKPNKTLPASIAPISAMYVFANLLFVRINLISRPATRPYAASSKSIDGRYAKGGMPVIRLESSGVRIPQAKPYCHPSISPHSSTGICIGNNIWPGNPVK